MSTLRYQLLLIASEGYSANDFGLAVDSGVMGLTCADTGTGSDAAMAPCAIETAVAVDTAERPIFLADTASFDDLYRNPPIASYPLSASETASGVDLSLQTVLAAETGVLVDVATLVVTHDVAESWLFGDLCGFANSCADTGAGVDEAMAPWMGESVAASDAVSEREFLVDDTGAGAEAVGDRDIEILIEWLGEEEVTDKEMFLADNILAMDVVVWGQVGEDSGTATDEAFPGRVVRERGFAVDAGDAPDAEILGEDTADTIYEEASCDIAADAVADTAAGADAAVVGIEMTAADTATSSEVPQPEFANIEYPTGADQGDLSAVLSGDDTAATLEETQVAILLDMAESGSGSDAGVADVAHVADESAASIESLSPGFEYIEYILGSEAGVADADITGEDILSTSLEETSLETFLTVSDTASGSEGTSIDVAADAMDSGAVSYVPEPTLGQDEYAVAVDDAVVGQEASDSGVADFVCMAPLALETATGVDTADYYGPTIDDIAYGSEEALTLDVAGEEIGLATFFATPAMSGDYGSGSDDAALLPEGGVFAYYLGTESHQIVAEIDGADASTVIYEEYTLEASLVAEETATGSEEGVSAIIWEVDETAVGSEEGDLFAEPQTYPDEEGFAFDEGYVDAELESEDDGDSEVNAFWLPAGAYTVPMEARESALERELDILGG